MLTLVPVNIDDAYRKKWNVHLNDFVHLYKDGVKLRDTLYRKGGIGGQIDGYLLILKHVESCYSKEILKMSGSNDGKHLEDNWCIINQEGEEKVVFKHFDSPYLSGGCIYSLDSKYYNIETNELYCNAYHSLHTEEFLFLQNAFDDDKSKRGVLKINKKTGDFELFPEKKY